jgi:hypothetical protein
VRLTRITAQPATGAAAIDREALLVEAIWAAARSDDRLEHVSVQFGSDGIAVGIFTRETPETTVCQLIERVGEMSTILRNWNVTGIRNLPLPETTREND